MTSRRDNDEEEDNSLPPREVNEPERQNMVELQEPIEDSTNSSQYVDLNIPPLPPTPLPPPLLLKDPVESERQQSLQLREMSTQILELTTLDEEEFRMTANSNDETTMHSLEDQAEPKSGIVSEPLVDLVGGCSCSTNRVESLQAGEEGNQSTGKESAQSTSEGDDQEVTLSLLVLSSGKSNTAAEARPGAIPVEGILNRMTSTTSSETDASTSSVAEEAEATDLAASDVGASISPPLQRVVTATAVLRDDLEQEVRERILREAVQAVQVQPMGGTSAEMEGGRSVTFASSPAETFYYSDLSQKHEKQRSNKCHKCCYTWRWWLLALLGLLLIVIVLGAILGTQLPKTSQTSSPQQFLPPPEHPPHENYGDGNPYLRGNPSQPPNPSPPPLVPARAWDAYSLQQFIAANSYDQGMGLRISAWTASKASYEYIRDSDVWANSALDEHMMDVFVLLALYFGTNGPSSWKQSSGWSYERNVCSWHGVLCNSNGLLVGLKLASNGLNGAWTPDLNTMASRVEYLDLSGNVISFRSNSDNLKPLLQLQHLNLSNVGIYARSFDSVIGYQLTQLQVLDLSSNSMTGSLAPDIGNLNELQVLFLQKNMFAGSIPNEISSLNKLLEVRLEGNAFTGIMPPLMLCDRNATASRGNTTTWLSADCAELNCSCCSTCY